MSARRTTVLLLSLLLVDAGCARLFPATKQDEPRVHSARPRVEKTAARRREGSDVTLPKDGDPNWVGWTASMLVPCDSTTARAAGDSYCKHFDERFDSLRAPIDTASKRRP